MSSDARHIEQIFRICAELTTLDKTSQNICLLANVSSSIYSHIGMARPYLAFAKHFPRPLSLLDFDDF